MPSTTRTAGAVTTVADINFEQVTIVRAKVTVYTPAPEGASHVTHLACEHLHTSTEAAQRCAAQLAASARNYPERHRITITDDHTHRSCPSCSGTVFDATSHDTGCAWLAEHSRGAR